MADGHGTIAAYRRCPTRCAECRTAMTEYNRSRKTLAALGHPTTPLVDATPVYAHVEALRGSGMSPDSISKAAGVSRRTMRDFVARRWTRVSPDVARRILAVDAAPAMEDAAPIWRLIHGMAARGYSQTWVAVQIGQGGMTCLGVGRVQVRASTAAKIRALVDHCALVAGPSDRARGIAVRNGWQEAWLWEDLPCSRSGEAA